MNLTQLSLKRPVTMLMMWAAVVLIGVIGYRHLPVRRFPAVSLPVVQVVVKDPGASPSAVMATVSNPLENQLATLSNLYTLDATSFPGKSRIVVEFNQGTHSAADLAAVSDAVQEVAAQLPPGSSHPSLSLANPASLPVLNVAVSGGRPGSTSQWVQTTLVPRLEEVAGVGQITISGSQSTEISVRVNPSLLAALHVPIVAVAQDVAAANQSGSGGAVVADGQQISLATHGQFARLPQLADLPIAVPDPDVKGGAAWLPLHDLARVQAVLAPSSSWSGVNGTPAIGLSITEQPGADTVAVTNALLHTLTALRPLVPPGVHLVAVGNAATFTAAALASTQLDLFLAVFLAGLILFAFLHRWRHTLIVLVAIPTSIVATFALMWALGFSLDLISLMAFSLLVGFLVDDAIVVLENIDRHRRQGKPPRQAAYEGRMEIGAAAVAITLTDVVVYVPLAMVSGNVGAMFREFGLTIVSATLLSLAASFTLTPLLAAHWSSGPRRETRWARRFDAGFERLQNRYTHLLSWLLAHRPAALGMLGLSAVLAGLVLPLHLLSTSFIPPEDTGLFTMTVELPAGTPLARTEEDVIQLSRRIRALPGVVAVYAVAGSNGATYAGTLDVQLTVGGRRPSIFAVEQESQRLAAAVPNLTATVATANPLTPASGPPIVVHLLGPSVPGVQRLAQRVQRVMASLPSLTEVSNQTPVSLPEDAFLVSHAAAARWGVSVSAVTETVAAAALGIVVATYQPSATAPPENIVVQAGTTPTLQNILSLPVPSSAVGSVPLATIGRLVRTDAATAILQQNRLYADTVTADLNGPIPLGSAVRAVRRALRGVALPPGYQVLFGGQVNQQHTAFGPLLGALGLSVLLVYMLMAALYESLVLPLAILMTVPLASVGALGALALTGQTLNIFSIVGLIMLMGLVTKNAILLVDYTQTLRRRGYDRRAALVEAGKTRLRPIVMTSATMIMAMLPLALHLGPGSADHQPMAIAVIGGLVTSTLLTLGIIPVAYTVADDWVSRPMRTASGSTPTAYN